MSDTSIKDFEAAIAELESIVKKLEDGDMALEQSLALYERGVQLSRFCHARLEEAERRIEILGERGDLKPAPASFAAADEPEPAFDVNLFIRAIHLAVVEDEPAKRVRGVSLVPACSTAPPIIMLRQDCNVSSLSSDQ